jgi:hypothetical protein
LKGCIGGKRSQGHTFVEGISQFEFAGCIDKSRKKLVQDGLDHDETPCAYTGLTAVSEAAENSHPHGMVQISIVQVELNRNLFHLLRS